MISITVNDEKMQVEENTSLAEFLAQKKYPPGGAAIAINHSVVARAYHDEIVLLDGDIVHVVSAMQGG